jgi:hypothetical protein
VKKPSPETVQLEAQFEASAGELVDVCRECCDTSDAFIVFVSDLLSELVTMHHALNNLQNLPVSAPGWTIDKLLTEQLPTVRAAIVSVSGQIAAREHMLVNNIEVIANLHRALDKVKNQLSGSLIDGLFEKIDPLVKRTNQQLLSVRSLATRVIEEKAIYDGFADLLDDKDKPQLLN